MQTKAHLLRTLEVRLDDIDQDFEEVQRRVAILDGGDDAAREKEPDVDALEKLENERDGVQKKIDRLAHVGDESWRLLTGEISEALSSLAANMVATKERLEADPDM